MIFKNHKYIFYLIVLLLPLNLGKHFIFSWSYTSGLLVDYFIPTVFIQDILIILLLLLWLLSFTRDEFESLFNKKEIVFVIAFLFATFLSVVTAQSVFPAVYAWLHLVLYIGLFLYTLNNFRKEDWTVVLKMFGISVLILSVLAVFQWIKQGSLFNSYLFFGEQPYNFSTYGIVRESFFGFTRIPVYGLFRHPNTFGGFLAIVLVLLFPKIRGNKFFLAVFALGVLALFFTLSYISWGVFIFGLLSLRIKKKFVLAAVLLIILTSLTLPLIKSTNASIYRRADLLVEGETLIEQYPLFGIGLNNSPLYAPETRFAQPIHNVFVLIWAESGIFAFILFLCVLEYVLLRSWPNTPLFVSLLQIILLSSFDHYLFTIHQTQILFWILLGIAGSFSYQALAISTSKNI